MKNVIIPDKKLLEKKEEIFKLQGKEKIHVISDFDRTLTKSFVNQEKVSSAISVIRKQGYLGDDYSKKAYELFDKYHPIEISCQISLKKKKGKMSEWWQKHYELLKQVGMNKEILNKVINSHNLQFREGCSEFFNLLYKNNIPLIILSASGIGNCIKEFFNKKQEFYENIHIISNFIKFDEKGKMTGVKGKIIHPFNKNESSLEDLPIYPSLIKRKNVILIGDSLGDLGMIEGFDYNEIIKIGFLNYEKENLEKYKENFDIVILNDSDMGFVNDLLKKIINNKL